jgi:hypothetical protein
MKMSDDTIAPDGETKEEAFTRLAVARVRKALKMIDLIGNLASPQYRGSEEQVNKIEHALLNQVTETMRKLRKVKKEKQDDFAL